MEQNVPDFICNEHSYSGDHPCPECMDAFPQYAGTMTGRFSSKKSNMEEVDAGPNYVNQDPDLKTPEPVYVYVTEKQREVMTNAIGIMMAWADESIFTDLPESYRKTAQGLKADWDKSL